MGDESNGIIGLSADEYTQSVVRTRMDGKETGREIGFHWSSKHLHPNRIVQLVFFFVTTIQSPIRSKCVLSFEQAIAKPFFFFPIPFRLTRCVEKRKSTENKFDEIKIKNGGKYVAVSCEFFPIQVTHFDMRFFLLPFAEEMRVHDIVHAKTIVYMKVTHCWMVGKRVSARQSAELTGRESLKRRHVRLRIWMPPPQIWESWDDSDGPLAAEGPSGPASARTVDVMGELARHVLHGDGCHLYLTTFTHAKLIEFKCFTKNTPTCTSL